ncbi:MAG: hypothetical protein AAGI23_18985 [Bacteroidota bacterium]
MTDCVSIDNPEGTGTIYVKFFDLGAYLFYKEAKIIVWDDCQGSVGKYTALLNESADIKEKVEKVLQSKFNSGLPFTIQDILDPLKLLCHIFPTGRINITKHHSESEYSEEAKFKYWATVFLKKTRKSDETVKRQRYLAYFNEIIKDEKRIVQNIVDQTTTNFYDGIEHYLVTTQSVEQLDKATVEKYKDLIAKGKRPYCLVYNTQETRSSISYLLDGHHKLKAYCDLNINPCVIELTQLGDTDERVDVDTLEADIFDRLYTWQLDHILHHGFSEQDFKKLLNNPENRFNRLVKNGFVEERWVNGNLKFRGHYVNSNVEGVFEKYHENSQLASLILYKAGNQVLWLRSWYRNGNLQYEYIPSNDFLTGEGISYHPTGEIESKSFSKDSKRADGKSSVHYDIYGNVVYEAFYLDGQSIKQIWYDDKTGKVKNESTSRIW